LRDGDDKALVVVVHAVCVIACLLVVFATEDGRGGFGRTAAAGGGREGTEDVDSGFHDE